METIQEKLKERNFIEKDNGEFVKGNWTVRFDNEILEAFNNPDLEPNVCSGIYYSALINKLKLDELLDEINDKIEKK